MRNNLMDAMLGWGIAMMFLAGWWALFSHMETLGWWGWWKYASVVLTVPVTWRLQVFLGVIRKWAEDNDYKND